MVATVIPLVFKFVGIKMNNEDDHLAKCKKYNETVNHPLFREANRLSHLAEERLLMMGMTRKEAHDWISAWTSGAGDGIE